MDIEPDAPCEPIFDELPTDMPSVPAEIVIDVLTPLVFCSVHGFSQHLFLPIRQQPVAAEAMTAPTNARRIIPINFFMLFPFVFRPKNLSPAYVRNMILYFPHLFDLEYNEIGRNVPFEI